MNTSPQYQARLISILLLAGVLGLLLVHVTSNQEHRCDTTSFDTISLIKLI